MSETKSRNPQLHEARGLRLRIAVDHQHRHARAFGDDLEADDVISRGAFYSHYSGKRWPTEAKVLSEYGRRLGVPHRWLSEGYGESIEDLQAALALVGDRKTYPDLQRILPFFPPPRTQGSAVNQQLQEIAADSFIISQIRHIPILQDRLIAGYLSGERAADMMEDTIPVTSDLKAGPRAFGYRVAEGDRSMTRANGRGFLPGTPLVIDPDAPISPGCYVLAKPRARASYLLRRYQAAFDHDGTQPFTLEAVNPSFEAIRVTDPDSWEIAGRVIWVMTAPEAM